MSKILAGLIGFMLILVATVVATPAQASPYAYITNNSGTTVSVVDTATNTVTGSPITVGTSPYGVAVNATGSRVYVTNAGSGNVSVIDTSGNSVVATVSVGNSPKGVAVNPAGTRVYVANSGSGSVSVIDTSNNTVLTTVTVGVSPIGIAVNPAGTRVYVANSDDATLSVIDTSDNSVLTTVGVGASAFGVAVNPAGTRVYVSNNTGASLSVINASNNTVVTTVTVGAGPKGVAVNPAGTWIYVANNNAGTVSVIDASNNTVFATVAAGTSPQGLSVNPSGTAVYVASYGSSQVSVINASNNTISTTVAVAGPYSLGQFIGPAPAAPAQLSSNPASWNYNNVTVATPSAKTFTLSNPGGSNLVISNIVTSTGNNTMFVVALGDGTAGTCGNLPVTILPAGSCTISVTFTPTALLGKTTNLVITSNDSGSPLTILLNGTGIAAAQSIPTLSEWGMIILGCMLAGLGVLAMRRNAGPLSPA